MTNNFGNMFYKLFKAFKTQKKKNLLMFPVDNKWIFDKAIAPTLFIGDLGSGITETLTEIGSQAICAGKTVFYFTAFGDRNSMWTLSNASKLSNRESQFFVNDYAFAYEENWEKVSWDTILMKQGIVGCLMPALERCLDEVIDRSGKTLASALEEISLSNQGNQVVIIIDGLHYFDTNIQASLKVLAANGVNVYMRVKSFGLDRVNFDVASYQVFVMRVASSIKEHLSLAQVGLTDEQTQCLKVGHALKIDRVSGELEPCYFPASPMTSTGQFSCANTRPMEKG